MSFDEDSVVSVRFDLRPGSPQPSAQPRAAAQAFSQAVCGGLAMSINGQPVVMRGSGALWVATERTLVLSDLHLEKGSAYAARGQMLPPYDTRETLSRVQAEVAALEPERIVFLGDTFHDGGAEDRWAQDDADHLARIVGERAVVWIVGNHDPQGPRALPGERLEEVALGALVLRHEPSAGAAPGETAGHLHPCAKVKGRSGAIRRRCFVTDGSRLILPAFGAFTGGLNVLDAAFAGLFAAPPIAAVMGIAQVHAIGWRSLRPD